ncbi:hypothetical protein BDV95DRAFT_604019 [Massariosphaeria phaeospora]|uniref:Uncharacterized protein n=1 Tax=Massariosphaeria phaeospora TaxID=100035 RepID=A0A7C8MEX6_9PLEO|nr:hypothetical protein BDV95DRAFT_604019 [Massariosphaeria phaeospora]
MPERHGEFRLIVPSAWIHAWFQSKSWKRIAQDGLEFMKEPVGKLKLEPHNTGRAVPSRKFPSPYTERGWDLKRDNTLVRSLLYAPDQVMPWEKEHQQLDTWSKVRDVLKSED